MVKVNKIDVNDSEISEILHSQNGPDSFIPAPDATLRGLYDPVTDAYPPLIIIDSHEDAPTLEEAQRFVNHPGTKELIPIENPILRSLIEIWRCGDDLLVFNENGKVKDFPINYAATEIFHDNNGSLYDLIVGPAILIKESARVQLPSGEYQW